MSRKNDSLDFNVIQRAQVINKLKGIEVDSEGLPGILFLEHAQAGFVRRYLQAHPDDRDSAVEAVARHCPQGFPWEEVNRGLAKDLVISYCFPPFADTSAVVAAKVVAQRQKIVDVLCNDITAVRKKDRSLGVLAGAYIDETHVLHAPPSFSDWKANVAFATQVASTVDDAVKRKGEYRTLYSRALWVGSNFGALNVKLNYPSITWTAEFSDPLRTGADGKARPGPLVRDEFLERVASVSTGDAVADELLSELRRERTIFGFIERASLALADELIFTNDNQLTEILSSYTQRQQEYISNKATVRPHPRARPFHYALGEAVSGREGTDNAVRIGYFGNFYENRGLSEVLQALATLDEDDRHKLTVEVYTNQEDELHAKARELGIEGAIVVSPSLPYLNFLATAQQFDCLVVNDVTSTADMAINPFLPSKYSDYAGSGAKVWGIVEEGSPLSKVNLDFKTAIGNVEGARAVLLSLMS